MTAARRSNLHHPAAVAAPTGELVGYVRISRDREGRELGVDRQEEDCVRLAAILGIPMTDVVRENDKSASAYAVHPRELWDALLTRVRRGEVTHIVAATLSRLTRDMTDREELLALRHLGLSVTTAAGQRIYPTMSASEVHMIRMLGANDTAESDLISERTRRAFDQNAANGTPHGPIAYGWDRHHERNGEVVDTINPAQAAVIREAAARLLAGESVRGIARDLTDRAVPAPRGGDWSTTILKKVLLRERNAARRVHRGVVVGPAAWQAILDDDTFDSVVSLLNDPNRAAARHGNRYLLSGLIVCSKCEGKRVWITFPASSSGAAPAYACKSCHGLRRKAAPLDQHVAGAVCEYLATPGAVDWAAPDLDGLARARAHLAGLEARAAELADACALGQISLAQLVRSNATLLPEIEAARADVEAARPLPTAVRQLAELGDVDSIATFWRSLPMDTQRTVIGELVTITLLPTQRRKFDPDGVRLEFRS